MAAAPSAAAAAADTTTTTAALATQPSSPQADADNSSSASTTSLSDSTTALTPEDEASESYLLSGGVAPSPEDPPAFSSLNSIIGEVKPIEEKKLPITSPAAEAFNSALSKLLENSIVDLMEGLETLLVYTKNLILYPDEKKYRKIKITNIHYQERLGRLAGAQEAMSAIGYLPQGEYLRLDEKRIHNPDNESLLKSIELIISNKLAELRSTWASLPLRMEPNHAFVSVNAVGSHSAIGKRHTMEDDEIVIDSFCGVKDQGYFGLYDGHGGRATVDFVVKALHMNLEQHMKLHPTADLATAFKHSYLATDGQLRRQNILRSGSTSVTCVIRVVDGRRMLFVANVGDSRAVLCRGGKAQRMTIDHKASLPEEAKRIRDAGGFIGRNKRVNGVLAISRALGDHMLKNCGGGLNDVVSAEPYCADVELTAEDSYVLLACDGVWDVLTDQEAIDFMLAKIAHFEQQIREQKRKQQQQPNDMETNENGTAASAAAPATTATTTSTDASSSAMANGSSDSASSTADSSSSSSSSSAAPSSSSSSSTSSDADTTTPLTPAEQNDVLHLVAKALVREALDRRSLDNVTVMIIKL